jgi:hypothetical protein
MTHESGIEEKSLSDYSQMLYNMANVRVDKRLISPVATPRHAANTHMVN